MAKIKFKQTEIGMIPEGWGVRKLGCISNFLYGLGESSEKFGEFTYLRITDIDNDNKFKKNGLVKISKKKVKSQCILNYGDLLIARTGATYGKTAMFKEKFPATYGGFLIKLILNNNLVENEFLFQFTRSEKYWHQAKNLVGGGAQPQFNANTISELKIPLPPLPEQKAIAKILSDLDSKIEVLQNQNEALEKMGQLLFKRWFVDFEFPDEDGKGYRSNGGEMVESEMGEIPVGWRAFNLIDLVSQLKPGTNYQPKRVEKGIPFVTVKNIVNGFLSLENSKKITKEEYLRVHKQWKPEENDVLITRIGTLGNVAIIRGKDLPVAVHYNSIDIKQKDISYQFLYFLFKSKFFQEQYHLRKKQSVQEYVTIDEVEKIKILLPTENIEIKKMEKKFIGFFNKIRENQNQIESLTKLRDTLLPKLMSGKVRVK